MKHSQGLTLINLLISLSIISILTFLVIPGFGNILSRNQSTLTINTINSAVNFARSSAILGTKHITLCPKAPLETCGKDWSAGLTVFHDENQNGTLDEEESVLRTIELMASGTVKWSSFGANTYLTFTPIGFTKSQNGTFIYCPTNKDATLAKVLIINRQGRARPGMDVNKNRIPERANGDDVEC
ncbi:GspH/FimT family protein [Simiduia aestuariiviva]|uniref:Type II secretion system protein H n=1 Tax=Simiduia aestuariiviva TaxID=1510459 RepID=A0A839UXP2_9GAMM|nr:GspH/FimT family protein [Simiduia aestuariiviva]MBB3170127.1 type IV fimbrial biogenesis protein FimT [Simiduia aestuariiviva]